MSDLEQGYIQASRHLYDAAQQFADSRLLLIYRYMHDHHPDIRVVAKTMDDNLLSIDVVFPGLGRVASRELASEIELYLQVLLNHKDEVKL